MSCQGLTSVSHHCQHFHGVLLGYSSPVSQPETIWLRYMDDTFTLWPHDSGVLDGFLNHLNSLRPTIRFTMEIESHNRLPFLDVMVIWDPITHTTRTEVYWKPTHTDCYLNYRSYQSPTVKNSIIYTLAHRAEMICKDISSLRQEKNHLVEVSEIWWHTEPR